MIREMIRPSQCDLHITIPSEYINRDIELIIFALDEQKSVINTNPPNKEISSLRGVFNKYADTTKITLEDDAWQKHLLGKFNKDD